MGTNGSACPHMDTAQLIRALPFCAPHARPTQTSPSQILPHISFPFFSCATLSQVQESCSRSMGINSSTCPHMNTAQLMRMCQDMDLIAGPGAPSFYAVHTTNLCSSPRGSVSHSPAAESPRTSSSVGSMGAWQQEGDGQHGDSASGGEEAAGQPGSVAAWQEGEGVEPSFAPSRTAVPDAPPLTRQDVDLIVARCKGAQCKLDFPRWLRVLAQLSSASGLDLFTLLTDHVRRLKALARQQTLEQLAPQPLLAQLGSQSHLHHPTLSTSPTRQAPLDFSSLSPAAAPPTSSLDHRPQHSLERAVRTMPLHQHPPTLFHHHHHHHHHHPQHQPLGHTRRSPPRSAHTRVRGVRVPWSASCSAPSPNLNHVRPGTAMPAFAPASNSSALHPSGLASQHNANHPASADSLCPPHRPSKPPSSAPFNSRPVDYPPLYPRHSSPTSAPLLSHPCYLPPNTDSFSFSAPLPTSHPFPSPPPGPCTSSPVSDPTLSHSPSGTHHPLPPPSQSIPLHSSSNQEARSKSATSSSHMGATPHSFSAMPHATKELTREGVADARSSQNTPKSLSSPQISPLSSLIAPPRTLSSRSWSAVHAGHHTKPTFSSRCHSACSRGGPAETGDHGNEHGGGGSGRFQGPRSLAATFPRPVTSRSEPIPSRLSGSVSPGRAHGSFDPGWEVGMGGDGEGSGSGSGLLNCTHVGTDGGFSHAASRLSRYLQAGTPGANTGVPSYANVNALRTLPPGNAPKLKRPAGVAAEVWGLPPSPLSRPTTSASAPAAPYGPHSFPSMGSVPDDAIPDAKTGATTSVSAAQPPPPPSPLPARASSPKPTPREGPVPSLKQDIPTEELALKLGHLEDQLARLHATATAAAASTGKMTAAAVAAATAASKRTAVHNAADAAPAAAAAGGGKAGNGEGDVMRLVEEGAEQAEEAILRSIASTEPHDWARHKMLQAALVSVKNARIADKHAEAAHRAPNPTLSSTSSAQQSRPSRLAAVTHATDSPWQRSHLVAAAPAAEDNGSRKEGKPPTTARAPLTTFNQSTTAYAALMSGSTQEQSTPANSACIDTSRAAAAPAATQLGVNAQGGMATSAGACTGVQHPGALTAKHGSEFAHEGMQQGVPTGELGAAAASCQGNSSEAPVVGLPLQHGSSGQVAPGEGAHAEAVPGVSGVHGNVAAQGFEQEGCNTHGPWPAESADARGADAGGERAGYAGARGVGAGDVSAGGALGTTGALGPMAAGGAGTEGADAGGASNGDVSAGR
ncbi:hypothetical protein DUNSADRAFT_5547 [Dunaliella salina]|uniref:Uncharacterized protein n=1 Tax=Dunaliella salina TaxID=3046 RepID=A0ABQ7GQ30_DUNSA|nr:hypothetical protein DUNSADRAFT_5547 [Dunaliella salina]|eukprot:KAF5836720.1 hypothetical protein DUNSADRAFT_5547 [Dunaliella salina]